tara:strand:+ start:310 stop:420 length:111 start_codon:yes stop_codon:yes gene_type:complete
MILCHVVSGIKSGIFLVIAICIAINIVLKKLTLNTV